MIQYRCGFSFVRSCVGTTSVKVNTLKYLFLSVLSAKSIAVPTLSLKHRSASMRIIGQGIPRNLTLMTRPIAQPFTMALAMPVAQVVRTVNH